MAQPGNPSYKVHGHGQRGADLKKIASTHACNADRTTNRSASRLIKKPCAVIRQHKLSVLCELMMLKLSVIACLLAVAVAQTPERPKFSETFYATGEVEMHVAEETRFGKCECETFE